MAMAELQVRQPGASGLDISVSSLGTMRIAEAGLNRRQAADLLLAAADSGVTAIHTSIEYDGLDFSCDALRQAHRSRPDWRWAHVAKLAEPGVGETAFDPARFDERLGTDLHALDLPVIDVLQWIVRIDLADQP